MISVKTEDRGALTRLSLMASRSVIPADIMRQIGDTVVGYMFRGFAGANDWPANKSGKPLLGGTSGRMASGIHIGEVRENSVEVLSASKSEQPWIFIHQFGGTILQEISQRQVSFFWAMFYESHHVMWKAMALKYRGGGKGYLQGFGGTMRIEIPQREWFKIYDEVPDKSLDIIARYVLGTEESAPNEQLT